MPAIVVPGRFGPMIVGATASGASTATWDPANHDSQTSLSGGNLIATGTVGSFAASTTIATVGATTGKKYSEHTITTDNGFSSFMALGISVVGFTLTNSLGGAPGGNHIGYDGGGTVHTAAGGGGPVATIQTFTQGNVVCMAVDFGNTNIWWRVNGGNWNNNGSADPATNVGGISFSSETGAALFPAQSLLVFSGSAQVTTSNFGGSAYAQTAPSGFGNW